MGLVGLFLLMTASVHFYFALVVKDRYFLAKWYFRKSLSYTFSCMFDTINRCLLGVYCLIHGPKIYCKEQYKHNSNINERKRTHLRAMLVTSQCPGIYIAKSCSWLWSPSKHYDVKYYLHCWQIFFIFYLFIFLRSTEGWHLSEK